MKTLFLAMVVLIATSQLSQAQNKQQALIIQTSSSTEVDKILAALKDQDPATYRLQVARTDAQGRTITQTYGTARLGTLQKIGGASKVKAGAVNAFDMVMIGDKKGYVIAGKSIRDKIISQLDKNLTKQSIQQIQVNTNSRKL